MKIRNSFLLIMCAFMQVSTSFSMNIATKVAKKAISGLCTGTGLFLAAVPIVNDALDSGKKITGIQELQETQLEAPEAVEDLFTQISKRRGIENVKFVLDDNYQSYAAESISRIVFIPTKESKELELLIHNNKRSLHDEKKLNQHIASFEHELTHIERNSAQRFRTYNSYATIASTIGGVGLTQLSGNILKKYIPQLGTSFVLKNAGKVARGFGVCAWATYFMKLNKNMNLYHKYEELKTDDGVSANKEMLESFAEYFEGYHAEKIKDIEAIKDKYSYEDIINLPKDSDFNGLQLAAMKALPITSFDNPLVMDLVFYVNKKHPSDIRRANRIRDRIAKL